MTDEPETYPSGWDVSTGYYKGELRAEATGEHDERVVCLDNGGDEWRVTAGLATSDPEHVRTLPTRTEAATHFYDVLEDTDAYVRQSGFDVSVRDVFQTESGPVQVVSKETNGDLRVTDPTANHPRDTRSSNWTIERSKFETGLASGEIQPANLHVITDE